MEVWKIVFHSILEIFHSIPCHALPVTSLIFRNFCFDYNIIYSSELAYTFGLGLGLGFRIRFFGFICCYEMSAHTECAPSVFLSFNNAIVPYNTTSLESDRPILSSESHLSLITLVTKYLCDEIPGILLKHSIPFWHFPNSIQKFPFHASKPILGYAVITNSL